LALLLLWVSTISMLSFAANLEKTSFSKLSYSFPLETQQTFFNIAVWIRLNSQLPLTSKLVNPVVTY
jgi:hypothetical protein